MIPPDRLVQAAADEMYRQYYDDDPTDRPAGWFEDKAAGVLAAAFAALPIDEIREQAREVVRQRRPLAVQSDYRLADAASDVWIAALAREFGEQEAICTECRHVQAILDWCEVCGHRTVPLAREFGEPT